jgi:hypothetical protein
LRAFVELVPFSMTLVAIHGCTLSNLFVCIAFCYQCDVSLCIHVLHIVGLVVLYT